MCNSTAVNLHPRFIRVDDIAVDEREVPIADQILDVRLRSRIEIVKRIDPIAVLQQPPAEMTAEESCAASYECILHLISRSFSFQGVNPPFLTIQQSKENLEAKRWRVPYFCSMTPSVQSPSDKSKRGFHVIPLKNIYISTAFTLLPDILTF